VTGHEEWKRLANAIGHPELVGDRRFRDMGSLAFALKLLEETRISTAPGMAFGDGGEGSLRFSLIEDLPRIDAACEAIGRFLRR
jgi:alanine-synthesizing transaminase